MHRTLPQSRLHSRDSRPPSAPAGGQWLTQLAFLLTLLLVVCRMLIPESIRSAIDPLAGGSPTPLAPGPGSGLALDLLCCIPALLILGRRAVNAAYVLFSSWTFVPMGLLAVWAAMSPLWSADRFSATVSATHLFASLVFLWSTTQLVRSWLRLRLVAAACVGLLLALCVAGYYYRFAELQDMTQTWQEHKAEFLAEHGWKPDSFEALQFEKRVLAGQPMGFSASTNTYAALLVLLGVVAGGLVIQRVVDRDSPAWIVLPALATLATIPLIKWTQCRAAFATPIIAAMMLSVVARLGPHLARHARTAYAAGVVAVALATAFLVRHGLRTGTLWHESLTFRWHYWIGSFRVFRDHWLAGVGWENFGPFYLGRRLPVAAEEIRDPHNFVVRVFVELGAIGGALLVAWLLSLWWDLTRPSLPSSESATSAPAQPSVYGKRFALLTVGLIAFIGVALATLLGVDWNAAGAFVLLEIVRHAMFLVAVAAGLGAGAFRGRSRPADAEPNHGADFELDDRPAPWVLYAILAGLATFLIHNLIEFSLFEPGPLLLFTLLTGSAMGIRLAGNEPVIKGAAPVQPRSRVAWVGLCAGGLLWLGALFGLVVPVASAEGMAHDADDNAREGAAMLAPGRGQNVEQGLKRLSAGARQMSDAFARLPMNADYAARAARMMIAARLGQSDPKRVRQMLDAAVAADPSSVSNLTMRAQFELSPEVHDPAGARRDYEHALALDPNNVRLRLDYARQLQTMAADPGSKDLAAEALREYRLAEEMNSQLSPIEPKRLSSDELAEIHRAIAELEAAQPSGAPATRPAPARLDRGTAG
ncbi:MAG: lipid core-O-antigen ligase-like enyme [Phycisphaerales bacterium]|nr:lipid core-O-antigen ligase-like enyme [Phycisphaerales bacterium]